MTTIIASGYIIADNEGTIHGTGASVDLAWQDAEGTLVQAQVTLLDDDADTTGQISWTLRSGLTAHPASAALIDFVEASGTTGWRSVAGVACTIGEADGE